MIPKLRSSAIALALPLAVLQPAEPGMSELATMQAATARFENINVAFAEGYVVASCQAGGPAGSASSGEIYFVRPELLGMKPATQRTRATLPSILIYQARGDGSLRLVAVEDLAVRWAWRDPGEKDPPRVAGLHIDMLTDDPVTKAVESRMFVPRVDRHLWIFDGDVTQERHCAGSDAKAAPATTA